MYISEMHLSFLMIVLLHALVFNRKLFLSTRYRKIEINTVLVAMGVAMYSMLTFMFLTYSFFVYFFAIGRDEYITL